VKPAPVTPPADTTTKAIKQPDPVPVKQSEVTTPVPVTQPVVTPPVPVTTPADTTAKIIKAAPIVPNPATPIDTSTIKQSVPMPADTSGHK
jgi:hypothetical protein